jgi:hypothetical protein
MSFGIPAALLFGLVLIIASLSLFITSKLKPNLYEDSDNIYVVVGIVCGLLLLVSLDLGAAMALQQMLMVSATITLMWRLINLRAENKQLKGRQQNPDRGNAVYNARLEEEAYLDAARERRQPKRRRTSGYDDDDRRLLRDSQEPEMDSFVSRRRSRSFDAETGTGDWGYGERRDAGALTRRSAGWEDEQDWKEEPRTRNRSRRALPDADSMTAQSSGEGRSERQEFDDDIEAPRRRRRPSRPSGSAEGSMANYVDYEPIDPHRDALDSGNEPINFPDRY